MTRRNNPPVLTAHLESALQSLLSLDAVVRTGPRAIEAPDFPFERIGEIAKLESWRKEIYRPPYHLHKWWAQRLGSVFRALVLATFAPAGADVLQLFYSPTRLPQVVVFDPFMGSGTTVGETLKAGGRAIGRDINPVAYFLVKNALHLPDRQDLLRTFKAIETEVAPTIQRFYQAVLPDGRTVQVLYYFWVMQVPCLLCEQVVDLFPSYIFAEHAYRREHPEARAICPVCGAINVIRYDSRRAVCTRCHGPFAPKQGPAKDGRATCPYCASTFRIIDAVRKNHGPPSYRMYAKLVLTPDGVKEYLPADDYDIQRYQEAERELRLRGVVYPQVAIQPGYNTNQVLNYSFSQWHQMFNARQLLCLSLLADQIRLISDENQRELFCCLLSGTLEFNNMFASFKGEGTGAVRHMFYHHILKPELTPLEANVWGTSESSGAFSTLFATRVLRAVNYCQNPFEVRPSKKGRKRPSEKVPGLSIPLSHQTARSFEEFKRQGASLYLSCGDSSATDLEPASVDAVITDPPFFDNVHYSELADFFYVWQRHILGPTGLFDPESTRSTAEVQTTDPNTFTARLARVWAECHRVLHPDGLLVFTYHHSRPEGWEALLASLIHVGFQVVRVHVIKAEMSVAAPKQQSHEPIDLDAIVVCRKRPPYYVNPAVTQEALIGHAVREAREQVSRLRQAGLRLSRSDVQVVVLANAVAQFSCCSNSARAVADFKASEPAFEVLTERLATRT